MRPFRLAATLAVATLALTTGASATPVAPLPAGTCAPAATAPYVCVHASGGVVYVTCAVDDVCDREFAIPVKEAVQVLGDRVEELFDDLPPGGCAVRPTCR